MKNFFSLDAAGCEFQRDEWAKTGHSRAGSKGLVPAAAG
jgi:hypothetical protein